MGPDGHTASLFPHSAGVRDKTSYVIANAVDSPLTKGPTTRLTITLPVINAARHVRFLVAGADKAETLAQVARGPSELYPSSLVAARRYAVADRSRRGSRAHLILAGDIGGTKTSSRCATTRGTIVREATEKSGDWASLEQIVDEFAPGPVTRGVLRRRGAGRRRRREDHEPAVDDRDRVARRATRRCEGLAAQRSAGDRARHARDSGRLVRGAAARPARRARHDRGDRAGHRARRGDRSITMAAAIARCRRKAATRTSRPAPRTRSALLRFLRGLYGDHVSDERVLSGHGIGDLYGFCASVRASPSRRGSRRSSRPAIAMRSSRRPGSSRRDPCAVRALAMFAEILGAEAGNLALRAVATGGIVIGGGIPPKILPALQTGACIHRADRDKGRFSTWTRALSVRVALEPRAALSVPRTKQLTCRTPMPEQPKRKPPSSSVVGEILGTVSTKKRRRTPRRS